MRFRLVMMLVVFAILTAVIPFRAADSPSDGGALPKAPPGCTVRLAADFTAEQQEPVRVAAHPVSGDLYVLGGGGDVYLIDKAVRQPKLVFKGTDYIDRPKDQNLHIPLPANPTVVNAPLKLR